MFSQNQRKSCHRDLKTEKEKNRALGTFKTIRDLTFRSSSSVHQLMDRGRRPGMEYYSAMRYKEIPPFAVIWMDLTLNEISQTEKNKYCMI